MPNIPLSRFANDANALRKSLTAHTKADLEDLYVEVFDEEPPELSRQRLVSAFIEAFYEALAQGRLYEDIPIRAASLPADLRKHDPAHDPNTIMQAQAEPVASRRKTPNKAKDKETSRLDRIEQKNVLATKRVEGATEETQQLREAVARRVAATKAKLADAGKIPAPPAPEPGEWAAETLAETDPPGKALFVSRNPEGVQFSIQVANRQIRPSRTSDGQRLIFEVPTDLAARFAMHAHVKSGRLIPMTQAARDALGV